MTNGNGAGATSGALYAIGATGANGRTDGFALEQAMAMSTTTAIYQKKKNILEIHLNLCSKSLGKFIDGRTHIHNFKFNTTVIYFANSPQIDTYKLVHFN